MNRAQFIAENPIADVIRERGVDLKGNGENLMGRCPFHPDSTASLSVSCNKRVWNCFAGCGGGSVIDFILKHESLSYAQFAEKYGVNGERTNGHVVKSAFVKKEPPPDEKTIDKIYSYQDQIGRELFQVVRYKPKTFRQRHKIGDDWVWGMNGVQRVLYKLPEITNAKSVWVCFSPDTEVLTPSGWVRVHAVSENDFVAQYDQMDSSISFTKPQKLVSYDFDGEMVSIAGRCFDIMITPDHVMLVKKQNRHALGSPERVPASAVNIHYRFPVSGYMPGDRGPSDNEARLLASIQADALLPRGFHLEWNLKKDRKKERLRYLLSSLSIKWREKSFKSTPEWTLFIVDDRKDVACLNLLTDKHFTWDILNWNISAKRSLIDELRHWDGDTVGERGHRFFTSNRSDAEIISAVGALCGYSTVMRSADRRSERPNVQVEYIVSLTRAEWRQIANKPTRIAYKGRVFCCTVQSHNLLTRRNGKVVITGQCEGEKDVESLIDLGYVATTNPGGSSSWLDAYADFLIDKDVVLCGDNDEPGRKHMERVFDSLAGKAASVRILPLPQISKDVTDYIATFGAKDEAKKALDSLIASAHPFIKGYKVSSNSLSDCENGYRSQVMSTSVYSLSLGHWLPSFKCMRPLIPGEFMVIIGDVGTGKTALLSSLAISACPTPTLFFELELPQELLFERLIAAKMGVRCKDVEHAYKTGNDMGEQALKYHFRNLFICAESGLTLSQMEEQILRAELKMGVRPVLVFVDYLQLISGRSEDRYERMSDIAERLKVMAKQLRIIIVAASQVHRPKDGIKQLNVHSAKDSSAIESSCGVLLGAWRDDQDASLLNLQILKSTKDGGGRVIRCNFFGETMTVNERAI